MYLNKDISNFIQKSIDEKMNIVVTSVSKTQGSTYAKRGNIHVVNSNGDSIGVLGSPFLQTKILELSTVALTTKEVQAFESIPKDESTGHGLSEYKLEPFFYEDNYLDISKHITNPYSLLIFGSGAHVTALISMANMMGWKTTVIDINMRKEFVKEADELIKLDEINDIFDLDLNQYNASVILSHSPKTDHIYLEALLKSNMEYLGMMGNKKNMQQIAHKFNLENDSRFFAPVGFDIGGNTSQAIALSICAQIEAKKNKKI